VSTPPSVVAGTAPATNPFMAVPAGAAPATNPFMAVPAPSLHQTPECAPYLAEGAPPSTASPKTTIPATTTGQEHRGVRGPCRLETLQAVFDPLLDTAMGLHEEAAGKEGVRRGLQELYSRIGRGGLSGIVQEKLLRLVSAIEARDIPAAHQTREQIVKSTTNGWVEGGTWQWALKSFVEAAKQHAPAEVSAQPMVSNQGSSAESCNPEVMQLRNSLTMRLAHARTSMDARKHNDVEQRLNRLYEMLQTGIIGSDTIARLLETVQAADQGDTATAQRCLLEVAKTDFESSKAWLPALKQLFRQQ